jgi:cell division protein FtsW (lipid II flippase)
LRALFTIPSLFICAWFYDGRAKLLNVDAKRDFSGFIACGLTGIVGSQLFFNFGAFTILLSAQHAAYFT